MVSTVLLERSQLSVMIIACALLDVIWIWHSIRARHISVDTHSQSLRVSSWIHRAMMQEPSVPKPTKAVAWELPGGAVAARAKTEPHAGKPSSTVAECAERVTVL